MANAEKGEVQEQLTNLMNQPGAIGYVLVNYDGIPVKHFPETRDLSRKQRKKKHGSDAGAGHAFLYRGVLLPNCATVRFLGVELCRGSSFRTKVDGKLYSFYRGSNSLLSRAGAAGIKSLPHLLFYLYKVHCLPILRYCNKVQLDTLTRRDRAKIRIAHNSMVRRIFSLPRWESVPEYYALDRFLEVSLQQV